MSTQQQKREACGVKNVLHGFFSFAAAGFVSELPASSCIGMLVRAPCAIISFLSPSALPVAIVKMAPCNPPSASRYWIVSESTFDRNRLRNRPPPYGANMVSVPIVPRNTRWLSFPVTTSSMECSGTVALALEPVNWRLPPSRVSRPFDFALTPSKPMYSTTLVPVSGCCASVGSAVNPTMPNRAIVAVCIERKTIAVSLTGFANFSRLGSRKGLRTRLVSGEQQSAVRPKKSMLALRGWRVRDLPSMVGEKHRRYRGYGVRRGVRRGVSVSDTPTLEFGSPSGSSF